MFYDFLLYSTGSLVRCTYTRAPLTITHYFIPFPKILHARKCTGRASSHATATHRALPRPGRQDYSSTLLTDFDLASMAYQLLRISKPTSIRHRRKRLLRPIHSTPLPSFRRRES